MDNPLWSSSAVGNRRTDGPASDPIRGGLVPVLPAALGAEEDRSAARHPPDEGVRVRPLADDAPRDGGQDAPGDAPRVPGHVPAGAEHSSPQAPDREVPELRRV